MTAAIAATVVRARHFVVAFWVAAAAVAVLSLPTIEEAKRGSLAGLVASDAEAIDVEVRAVEQFAFPFLSRTVVVQRDPGGLSPEAQARALRRAAQLGLGELPGLQSVVFALAITNALGEEPFARERSTTALTSLFFPPELGRTGREGLARRLVERHVSRPGDAFVGLTGAVPARNEQVERISDALPLVELLTVLLVVAVIAGYFRALGAALVNLAAVGITYVIAARAVAGAGDAFAISVPEEIEPVMVALLFGIVTDYSIFFLSRFRGRLRSGSREAASETLTELLPIVLAAGLTIAGASAALVLARLGFYQAFGPGLALSVLIAVAVVTTFVPAALAIGGERVFWPGGGREGGGSGRWIGPLARARTRLLELPSRRPLPVALLTAAGLLALASGVLRLDVGNAVIQGLPEDSEPRVAYRAASEGFAPGILAPTMVLVEGDGVAARRAELTRLQRLLERRRGVALVAGPRQQPAPLELGAVLSPGGDAARYLLVLDADPLGSRAIKIVERLRDDLDALLERAGLGGATAGLAGDTALSEETVTTSREDALRVLPAAAIAIYVVLAVLLRALVAPLYLLVASVLALGASLGLAVYVFEDLLGFGEISYYVPFAAMVLLLALGSDYNVYLAGRIWREARRRPLRQAVVVAGVRAARTITLAALVLALSFALLGVVPLRPFRELSVTMAAGLLIDAFVVRTLLAPALITLVGEHGAWPRRSALAAARRRWGR